MTTLGIRIAGVGLDLRWHGETPPGLDRYRRFAGGTGPDAWTLELRPGRLPPLDRYTGRVLRRGQVLLVEGLEGQGQVDVERRRVQAVIDPRLLALDGLVRAALQLDAQARGGCFVHAAALLVGGRAHLFPGRSGSGKSTLAALAGHVLSDELCVVLPTAGGYEVHGTPWWNGRGESAPLAAVYRLAWGGEGATPLGRGEALRHLATNLVLPLADPGREAAAFESAGRIAAAVPFGRLAFLPHSDVDALLWSAGGLAA